MKKQLLFITLVSIGLWTQAQTVLPKKTSQNVVQIKSMNGVMMDQSEVTVGEWFAFINAQVENQIYVEDNVEYLDEMGEETLNELLPDRTRVPSKIQWLYDHLIDAITNSEGAYYIPSLNSNALTKTNEYSDEITRGVNYPVTGISLTQVQEYLQWRQELMEMDKQVNKLGLNVVARLITPEEWDKLATKSGPREPSNQTIYPDSINTKGCYLINCKYVDPCESTEKFNELYQTGLFPTSLYFADVNGLYDIFGNVAEMTSKEGISKGGSYNHWAGEGYSGKTLTYSEPKEWLGFRVIFEFSK